MKVATKRELVEMLNRSSLDLYRGSTKACENLTKDQITSAIVFLEHTKDILKIKSL